MARTSYLVDLDRVSTAKLEDALVEFQALEDGTGLGLCDASIEAIADELARRLIEKKMK